MKKIFIFGFLALSMLTSCDNSGKKTEEELANERALNEATREELQTAVTERDELLSLINEINASVDEIRETEKVITINGGGTETNSKQEIVNNLAAIKATLADRRAKLAALEAKYKESKLNSAKLLETIEGLRKQIDAQEEQISSLTAQLESANRRIGELGNTVDSLNNTVRNVTDERNAAEQEALAQANLANECFFAVGSKKELKEHNILESGFLRKTKIMQSDFDKSFFTKADKRTLKVIQLHSKKAKVVTSAQPANSYEIVDMDGEKVLRILNPGEFWGTSNFVVIQVD